jgi:predicted nucleotidyltransferase
MAHAVPEPVREVMQALTDGAREILGDRLLGLYLGGSASVGDFVEASSDVDFLAVTDGPLTDDDADRIAALHERLRREVVYGDRLEGEYAPRSLLVPEGTLSPVPEVKHGRFRRETTEIMISADNHFNVREEGIAFAGPDPRELVPMVSADQVRAAVREMLAEALAAGPIRDATPARAASEILDLVRSARAIESGRPCTKSEGAAWALARLSQRWHALIRSALAVRAGSASRMDELRVVAAPAALYCSVSRYSGPSPTEA